MKNILITGGAGFIGSNLVKLLTNDRNKYKLTIVDNMSNGEYRFLTKSNVNLRDQEWIESDFAHPNVLQRIRDKNFDVVIHLAAVPRVSYSVKYPIETNDVNVSRTLSLIEACKGNVEKFIFASSSSVYGNVEITFNEETLKKEPVREYQNKHPESPYALQKSIIEDYLFLYRKLYDFDSVSLRFFNVFGPNALGSSPYATALASWMTSIYENRPMRSDGDGMQSRDMCYVDNVTHAIRLCIEKVGAFDREDHILNVSTGNSVSNNEILLYLMKRYPNATILHAPERPGDVKHTLGSTYKAKCSIGYQPPVLQWDGIEKTCDWFDKNWEWIKNINQSV